MSSSRHKVRYPPLPREEWPAGAEDAVNVLPEEMRPPPGAQINVLSVLARRPGLLKQVLLLGMYFRFDSSLDGRQRELLILRTAWLRRGEYELLRHARLTTFNYTGFKHAVASTSGGTVGTYHYDDVGAMDKRNGTDLVYDAQQRLIEYGTSEDYLYGVSNQRLIRTVGTTRTLYLPGMEATDTAGVLTTTRFLTLGGTTIGTRTLAGGVATVAWNCGSLQNSVVCQAPASSHGTIPTRKRYKPYGDNRNTAPVTFPSTDHGFLNQPEDASGLTYLNNRYYDPSLGHFVSVDPLVGKTGTPYIYGAGSPSTLADSSGLDPHKDAASDACLYYGHKQGCTDWRASHPDTTGCYGTADAPPSSSDAMPCMTSGGASGGSGCGVLQFVCDGVQVAVEAGQVLVEVGEQVVEAIRGCLGDPVVVVLCAAALMQSIPGGGVARDAINKPLNEFVLSIVKPIGDCRASDGITICVVPADLKLEGTVVIGTSGVVDLSALVPTGVDSGGTTVGSVYLTSNENIWLAAYADKRHHEAVHSFQWAAAGVVLFPGLYGDEVVRSHLLGGGSYCQNRFEVAADLADGGYGSCL